ncbi:MAG: haloacid dehalogenase type II [Ramlibacter sp.]
MTPQKPDVLLFDVNETLLDLSLLEQRIEDVLLTPGSAKLWFATMLQHSLAMTVSGHYAQFVDIGAAVLRMLGRNSDIVLGEEDARQTLSLMRQLPPHPDVEPALARLKKAGWRMATLTNSSQAGVKAQMQHARLDGFFERQLSVESVGKFKPHRQVYEWAAREMGVQPSACMLVAAHGWDVAGAKWAGLKTAFIAREGQQQFPLAQAADIDVSDLVAFAGAMGA